jgi:Ca2+-transporting ATPase
VKRSRAAFLHIGLSEAEAAARLSRHGRNEIKQAARSGPWRHFARQILNPLAIVLLCAAMVSLGLDMSADASFILIVIGVNVVIGGAQEFAAERSAQALQSRMPRWAHVVREGVERRVPIAELAPGDLVRVTAGDRVPADIELLEASGLSVDESLLTGESQPAMKDAEALPDPEAPPAERPDRVFAGTTALSGAGLGEVIATGMKSELGRIAAALDQAERVKPPLLVRMEQFTWRILVAIALAMVAVYAAALAQGRDPADMLLTVVALGVSAIPEGLPAAVAITLAIGVRRMAKRNVIVRRLMAVESLGSCTFIASDKTGTLTENRLSVGRILAANGDALALAAFAPDKTTAIGAEIARALALANEARATGQGYRGDAVDVACMLAVEALGQSPAQLQQSCPRLHLTPYESAVAFCAAVHLVDGAPRTFVKGSPERVLAMCARQLGPSGEIPFDQAGAMAGVHAMAADGYRVLAIAEGGVEEGGRPALSDLVWLGLVGMIDPPRPEAPQAIAQARSAGIEIAMVTGDHPATALAIARQLGLAASETEVVTGREISAAIAAGAPAVERLIEGRLVFARVQPEQKQAIVSALKSSGHFVAVTGDGINDAPALRAAHVGVAMGGRGADVARDNADLILADDNFASIVAGIVEGRVAYANIRKVIYLLVTTGVAEVLLILLALAAALPLPLLPVQLLWLNLVTNGIQDVALSFDPAEGNELRQPPRRPNEPIFDRRMTWRVLTSGIYMALSAFILFWALIGTGHSQFEARNIVLLAMVLFENVQALISRSERSSLFGISPFSNAWLSASVLLTLGLHLGAMHWSLTQEMLHLAPPALGDTFIVAVAAVLVLPLLDAMVKGAVNRSPGVQDGRRA